MTGVRLWLAFALFLWLCYSIGACGSTPADTATGMSCAIVPCCRYDVQYHTKPTCAPEEDFSCRPTHCDPQARIVDFTCADGVTSRIDIVTGVAVVTRGDCTETLSVSAVYLEGLR